MTFNLLHALGIAGGALWVVVIVRAISSVYEEGRGSLPDSAGFVGRTWIIFAIGAVALFFWAGSV